MHDSREHEVHCVYFLTWNFILFFHHFISITILTWLLCVCVHMNYKIYIAWYAPLHVFCGRFVSFICATSLHSSSNSCR